MKTYQAVTKFVRVPPRKARLAADLVRGMPVAEARRQLEGCGSKGGRLLVKTLDSAVANAEMQSDLSRENLKVETIYVNEGPRLKRSKPRSRGSSHPILKRMSHFTVVVGAK